MANLMEEYVGNPSETDSVKLQISSKTSRGKKDSTKRYHHRHHQRQPGEQSFPIQVVTELFSLKFKVIYVPSVARNCSIVPQQDRNAAVLNKLHSIKPSLGEWQPSYRIDYKEEVTLARLRFGNTFVTHSLFC